MAVPAPLVHHARRADALHRRRATRRASGRPRARQPHLGIRLPQLRRPAHQRQVPGHRADHLGFGRPEKPRAASLCTVCRRVEPFDALLEPLDLHGATVVPQDWSGPIGLSWAVAHPERVERLFILNTFAHRPPWKVPIPLPLRLSRPRKPGEVLVKGLKMFVRGFLFPAGVIHPERLTARRTAPTWRRTPGRPAAPPCWPSPARSRPAPTARRPSSRPGSKVACAATHRPAGRDRLRHERPRVHATLARAMAPDLPHADVLRLADAGHYLQEDAHERIIPALLHFLGRPPRQRRDLEPASSSPRSPQPGHRCANRAKHTAPGQPSAATENARITRFGRSEMACKRTPRAVQNGGYGRGCVKAQAAVCDEPHQSRPAADRVYGSRSNTWHD